MQQKDYIGIFLALLGIGAGVMVTTVWKRSRDFFFVAMLLLAPMTEDYDVNFVSRDFYRGTTRGFEFSLVDILSISLLVSAILLPRRQGQGRFFWPASFGLMLLFFAYCCFNVGMADPRLFGYFELSKMVRGMTIFLAVAFFLRTERELRLFLLGMGLIVCYEGLLGLKQRYLVGLNRVPGTLDDSNSLSVFFCTTTPLFVAAINSQVPKWLKGLATLAIMLACVGMVLTISRAGVVIISLVLLATTLATISYRVTLQKFAIGLCVLVGASGIAMKSWNTLKARFATSDLKAEYGNNRNMGRGYYIRVANAIMEDRFFGVGLNNWSYWVSEKYGPALGYRFVHYKGTDHEPSHLIVAGSNVDDAQAAPAHSLGALTAGELGWPGLFLFALLWLRWFLMGLGFLSPRTPDPMRRIGVGILFCLGGIFLQSLTEWVFRHSPIYYTVNIQLGALAALCYARSRAKLEKADREGARPSAGEAAGIPARPVYAEAAFRRVVAWANCARRPGCWSSLPLVGSNWLPNIAAPGTGALH
jgi:hypothetical protein